MLCLPRRGHACGKWYFCVFNQCCYIYILQGHKDAVSAVLQGILIGVMCIPWTYNYLSNGFALVVKLYPTNSTEKLCNAASFYLALFLAFGIITSGWLYFIQGLNSFWVIWVVEFVIQDPQRLYLCGYWICVLSTCGLPFYMIKRTKFEQILVRKFFHLMVVFMSVQALLIQVSTSSSHSRSFSKTSLLCGF